MMITVNVILANDDTDEAAVHFYSSEIAKECRTAVRTKRNRCVRERRKDISNARSWYKITDQQSSIDFPLAGVVPWLEQNISSIRNHYRLDPFESRYMSLTDKFTKDMGIIASELSDLVQSLKFRFITNQDYSDLYAAFNKAVQVCLIQFD